MGLFETLNAKGFIKIVNALKSKEFEDLSEKTLEEELSKRKNKSELYEDIANCYFMLLSLLEIDAFNSLYFPDYEDSRRVIVDEVEYDFDSAFSHNDRDATDALCAMDGLLSDLGEKSLEKVLKKQRQY